jgi:hypothetical protein
MKVVDISLTATSEGTLVNLRNALGQRVAKTHLPGCGDFNVLGCDVMVKMPANLVRSLLKGKGAYITTNKTA